ncbi:RDD family protein [Mycobacterium sp. NPDC050551]|uniref:RDD family protein n=1 Tax=Mycobacterium sp. NPDC050551 TaxID=3155407 RepID=UPI003437DD34
MTAAGSPTAEQIRELLGAYGRALDAADALPPFVRIAARPRRWTALDGWRRLPRPTFGVSTMLVHHVHRSTDTLGRRYDRLAATRGLNEDEQRAGDLVKAFHASLPTVRWKAIIAVAVIAVFVVAQVVLPLVAGAIASSVEKMSADTTDLSKVEALLRRVIPLMSSVPSAESVVSSSTEFRAAGVEEFVVLLAILAIAVYIVVRPLMSAFRIKRILLNLGTAADVSLERTTTSWNVSRGDGVYRLEAELFSRLGARAPHEVAVDLWLSTVTVAVLAWAMRPNYFLFSETRAAFVGIIAFGAALVGLRAAWLLRTARLRRLPAGPTEPACGLRTGSGALLEKRAVLETAGLGLVSFIVLCVLAPLPLVFIGPSPVWMRLVREHMQVVKPDGAGWWPALGFSLLLWVVPPVPLAVHLTRLARLQGPAGGSARRTRAWLVPLSTVVNLAVIVDYVALPEHLVADWRGVTMMAAGAMFAIAFAVVQREQNAVAETLGAPVPFDEPEQRLRGTSPERSYVPWLRRAAAATVDALLPTALIGIGIGYRLWTSQYCVYDEEGFCLPVSTTAGMSVFHAAIAATSVYVLWNWGYRQGRSGATLGKSVLHFVVVSEKTGAPAGFVKSVARLVLHLVDALPLLVGFLFPLWSSKRQTLADMLVGTVCLPAARPGTDHEPDVSAAFNRRAAACGSSAAVIARTTTMR